MATLVWTAALTYPDGKVHIWAVGSKSSLSLVIRSPGGNWGLVNPQKSTDFLSAVGEKMPFYTREINLVVLLNSSASSFEALSELEKRYFIKEVWLPKTEVKAPFNIKMIELEGQEVRSWQGIVWHSWAIPSRDMVSTLEISTNRLMFANRGDKELWDSIPEVTPVSVLVGPVVGRSSWSGRDLQELVRPSLHIVNEEVESLVPTKVAGEVEIVW